MSEGKATPRPWKVSAASMTDGRTWPIYADFPHGNVGFIGGKANASLIVRAVNAHDDLVAALREMVARHESADEEPAYVTRARAALQKATEDRNG